MRLLLLKSQKRLSQALTLSLPLFVEMMPQLAFQVFAKAADHLTTPEMLLKLIKHLERATKQKGQSTILYEDPDVTTIGDQELLKEMNRRMRENPDFILPEGYLKVAEKD